MASGSIPATLVTLAVLSHFNLNGDAARSLITLVLSVALFATAFVLVFGQPIVALYRARVAELDPRRTAVATVLVGVALGALVSISSVGAGAIGVIALMLLYPQLPMAKIVGSDIAHAVPLTLIAGLGHWMMGSVDWHIILSLLVGSLPGIFLGSYFAIRIPERALRLILASTLFVVASRIAYEHATTASSIFTAFTRARSNDGVDVAGLRGPALQQQRGVDAAEAEAIGHRIIDLAGDRARPDQIEAVGRIRRPVPD